MVKPTITPAPISPIHSTGSTTICPTANTATRTITPPPQRHQVVVSRVTAAARPITEEEEEEEDDKDNHTAIQNPCMMSLLVAVARGVEIGTVEASMP